MATSHRLRDWRSLYQALTGALTMLYDAVLHEPVAKLLCLFPCCGFSFLNQPVQEFGCHEGSLILHPLLFPRLEECSFRTHQSGGGEKRDKESKVNIYKRKIAHLKSNTIGFQEVHHRLPGSVTEELSDGCSRYKCQFQERVCVRSKQDAFSPRNETKVGNTKYKAALKSFILKSCQR